MIRVRSILNGDVRTKWRREYFDAGYGSFVPFNSTATTVISPTVQANLLTTTYTSLPAWLDYSGTVGNRMYTDSTGALTWAPNNFYLNSATLATQSVTVLTSGTYIVSFYGTGSIAFSNGATGTLSGTGVSNRVSVVINPTTTTVTSTVTGSVTSAQFERVTYQTSPRAYIPTTAAAVFQPRFDYDASTIPATAKGLLIEESRVNSLTYTQAFTPDWTDTNITRVSAARLSPDGTNNALEISASSANGTVIRTAAVGSSSQRAFSIWLKRVSGTGSIQYTLDNGSNWVTQAITSTWARYTYTATTANQQVGIRIVTSGDTIQIWGAQLEAGAFATSYIPCVATAVTRVADILKLSGAALAIVGSATGSAILQTTVLLSGTKATSILGDYTSRRLMYNAGTNTVLSSYNGTVSTSATIGGSGTWTAGAVRAALAWDAIGFSTVASNGSVATQGTSGTPRPMGTAATVNLGYFSSTNALNGWLSYIALYDTRLSDSVLRAKSAIGAPY